LLPARVSATPYLPNDTEWYDANKNWSGDTLLCWAAAGANILRWGGWQTIDAYSEQLIFNEFKEHWNDKGSLAFVAWQWWIDGTYPSGYPYSPDWAVVDVAGGGSHWPGESLGNYFLWSDDRVDMMTNIDWLLQNDYGVTLAVRTDAGGGHAITSWGYEFDTGDPDYFTDIYITDSDDGVYNLMSYPLTYDPVDARWEMGGSYNGWYISEVYALAPIAGAGGDVPEPSTLLLLLPFIGFGLKKRKLSAQ
jgi:hypothetical protein